MTTANHLHHLINHWTDLQAALGTNQADTWPPVMGIARLHEHLRADEAAVELRALERSPEQLGATAAPLRIAILDTMASLDQQLVDVADQIASSVQRPRLNLQVRSAGPGDDIALQLKTLILKDEVDERRWSWTNPRLRAAPYAAAWLLARYEDAPGPFRKLSGLQHTDIESAAAQAAEQVDQALEMTRRTQVLDRPCPHCRGVLRIEGGDGQDPAVKCRGCGRKWTGEDSADRATC
ncbi:hypothetical protein PV735_05415 [Streptomyces turgidiscabies]|uniref:Uncharacterized protein n=1 Tax=Streptomyces turgidiscabies (strain Car8) TaxID=698760 RepID=L7EXP0_STRT8|nr:hypothetical protein [Streptomyces turgidiscabies]ELP64178.1 hypothetical protein STRTUCAR8_05564 [Streptomyces turgidiscabies Car8]MDX3492128.1 hypothetical protein [Streptomyces turgidiscabies]